MLVHSYRPPPNTKCIDPHRNDEVSKSEVTHTTINIFRFAISDMMGQKVS